VKTIRLFNTMGCSRFLVLLGFFSVSFLPCFGAEKPRVDVLFAYTPAVEQQHSGHAGVIAYTYSLIEGANLAYEDSAIDLTLNALHVVEVDYVEQGDSADLSALRKDTDGSMDELHQLRDDYGADVVCLLVDNGGSGIAYVATYTAGSPGYAFSVVGSVSAGFGVFAHELGHNMGCAHDRENASVQGMFDYSYGFRFDGTDSVQYRTIMAYAPGSRIMRFSNPDIFYKGRATGISSGNALAADNAKTINFSASVLEAYRSEVPSSPVIEAEPKDITSVGGTELTLQLLASGTPPLTVQWYKGVQGNTSNPVSGLEGQGLAMTVEAGENEYWARVSNSNGSVDSRTVSVTGLTSWEGLSIIDQQQTANNTYYLNSDAGSSRSWQEVIFEESFLEKIEVSVHREGNPGSFGFQLLDENDLPIIERTVAALNGGWISIPIGVSVEPGASYRIEVLPGDSSTDYYSWWGTGTGNPYPQGISSRYETWDFAFRTYGGQTSVSKVATPTLDPDGGSFTGSVDVVVNCETSGATIRYTIDGSDPTNTSTTVSNGGTVTLTSSTTLNVKAFKSGMADSDSYSADFTIEPQATSDPAVSRLWPVDNAVPGNTISLWVEVKNEGNAAIQPGTVVRFWVSDQPDPWVGQVSVAGLAEGASEWYRLNWTIPESVSSGNLNYWAVVQDASGNNISPWSSAQSFVVSSGVAKPAINQLWPVEDAKIGATVPLWAEVENMGNADLPEGAVVKFWVSGQSDPWVGLSDLGSLAVAESKWVKLDWKIPTDSAAGPQNYWAVVHDDQGNGLSEWSNPQSFTISALAEASVTSLWQVENASPGMTVPLWAQVQNTGSVSLPEGASVKFWVSGQSDPWVGEASVAGLKSNAQQWFKLDWAIPSDSTPGTEDYWAIVRSSDGKDLSEWSSSMSFEISEGQLASIVSLWPVDGAKPGASVVLWAQVQNDSSASLPADARVWFYVKNLDSPWVGSIPVGGMSGGANSWYEFNWAIPSDMTEGSYSYQAVVWSKISGGQISEWSGTQSFVVSP